MDFSRFFSNGVVVGEEEEEADEGILGSLSYIERMSLFVALIGGTYICYTLSFVFVLSPRRFGVLWTVGSLLFLGSFCVLMGPTKFVRHFVSGPRLWYSASFFVSIVATLGFCFVWRSLVGVMVASGVQLVCTIAYSVSYFPLGRQSLELGASVGRGEVVRWLSLA